MRYELFQIVKHQSIHISLFRFTTFFFSNACLIWFFSLEICARYQIDFLWEKKIKQNKLLQKNCINSRAYDFENWKIAHRKRLPKLFSFDFQMCMRERERDKNSLQIAQYFSIIFFPKLNFYFAHDTFELLNTNFDKQQKKYHTKAIVKFLKQKNECVLSSL